MEYLLFDRTGGLKAELTEDLVRILTHQDHGTLKGDWQPFDTALGTTLSFVIKGNFSLPVSKGAAKLLVLDGDVLVDVGRFADKAEQISRQVSELLNRLSEVV